MKKFLMGLLIAASTSGNAAAQELKVINATKQNWSGGVVGHSGCNYKITLGPISSRIALDSIYVNNIGYKLIINTKGVGNVGLDTIQHAYVIYLGESRYAENSPFSKENKVDSNVPPVRHFNGSVLVVYKYKRKRCSLVVKELQSLPPIAYP